MQVWDIFCRVVDNYGDAGVTWRLARQLAAEHGVRPRLWIDDPRALAKMQVPVETSSLVQGVQGVEVRLWPEGEGREADAVADVVIEAFACELPAGYVRGMARRVARGERRPMWLNLDYLSAEEWVEGTHGLASPQTVLVGQDKVVLNKIFFFPGFTPRTGGLLREKGLLEARDAFQADASAQAEFWESLDVPGRGASLAGEVRISLFAYENEAVEGLLAAWAGGEVPVRLLVPVGRVLPQVAAFFSAGGADGEAGAQWTRGQLSAHVLPFTDQAAYDRLLWACDWNFVRGEDSFVRAQWAGRPFVWQIYPQAEAAHQVKLSAFWRRYGAGLADGDAAGVQACWLGWNGVAGLGLPPPDWAQVWRQTWAQMCAAEAALRAHALSWSGVLARQPGLAAQLVEFAAKVPE